MSSNTISAEFGNTKEPVFREGNFSQLLKENPTGAGYFGMNIAWMLAGYFTTGIDVAAGFTNFVGSSSRLKINPKREFLGMKNWDRRLGASTGALSTYISTLPKAVTSLVMQDYITFAAIVLNDALITGAQIVDFKSGELQGLDRSKYSGPIAKILENPSYYAGLGRAASRLLPIGLSLASGNAPVALAFVGLGLVDLYYTRTKAVTEYSKAAKEVASPHVAVSTAEASAAFETYLKATAAIADQLQAARNDASVNDALAKPNHLPLIASSRVKYSRFIRPRYRAETGKAQRQAPRFEETPRLRSRPSAIYDKATRRLKLYPTRMLQSMVRQPLTAKP